MIKPSCPVSEVYSDLRYGVSSRWWSIIIINGVTFPECCLPTHGRQRGAECWHERDLRGLAVDLQRGGSGWVWSCGAVQRSGDVIDNTTTPTAVSVSQWLCTVHQGALQQKSYRVSVRLNYLLYGDSYLTEYFRFNGIYSLNTETRVGFPDNGNYVILWITRVLTHRGLREFLVRITTVNDGDGSLHDSTANFGVLYLIGNFP